MNNVLITRPRHEATTNYLYYFAGEILDVNKKKNYAKIVDLKDTRANRKEFESVINKVNPSIIMLNGHGDTDTVTGHDNKPLLQLGENEQILHGKVVYALSCSSAKNLGRESVKKGAAAYLGYDDSFIFTYNEKYISKPLQDKTARLFLEPSNTLALSLLKGSTPKQAYKKSQHGFKKNIRKLLTSESLQEDKSHLPWLIWDMQCQICIDR